MAASGGVSRWTHAFTVASAASMVAVQAAFLAGASRRTVAVLGLFGAVLPMVFGMAYLLLPSYVGRTLSPGWLPGVHFALASAGAGLLVGDRLLGLGPAFVALGGSLWSLGVAVFLGALLWTVVPAVAADPEIVTRSEDRPQRSTRLGTATIPVAVAYLVAGTVALLSLTTPLPDAVGATLPAVVHYYGAGFAALMVFSLGVRLVTGFFHVSPPNPLAYAVLVAGAVGPAVLAPNVWRPPWFLAGACLEVAALAGYAALVGVVALRTERRRVGLYGIAAGAAFGAIGATAAALVAVGSTGVAGAADAPTASLLAVHVPVVLDGFLLLTIVGYAYQFFPVTNGQFAGATRRGALATIGALAAGVALQAVGSLAWPPLRTIGFALALLGTGGYAYLMARRLLW